jgi:hypothetical protein
MKPNNAIDADSQEQRSLDALLLAAGHGERYVSKSRLALLLEAGGLLIGNGIFFARLPLVILRVLWSMLSKIRRPPGQIPPSRRDDDMGCVGHAATISVVARHPRCFELTEVCAARFA